MPCTGVKASVEVRPPVPPPEGPPRLLSSARRLTVWFAVFVAFAAMRSFPEFCDLPSVPMPSSSRPNVSSAMPNCTRLAWMRMSVICVRSRFLRARAPPRFLVPLASGMGSAFCALKAVGSCHLSNFPRISSLNFSPTVRSSDSPKVRKPSTRAASAQRPETRRATFVRRLGGVPCSKPQPKMCPVCASCPPDANPPKVRFCTPRACTMPAGSPASLIRPPADPMRRAATSAPTMAVRLGATACMRDST
mmetsp:Transcript_34609/g.86357  ORF Transcript_34609/g.86357 Transcript_34609/m.86357 type:complete len:249 (+) Transcript_34609:237-983(+)